jgi:hypothetical protein
MYSGFVLLTLISCLIIIVHGQAPSGKSEYTKLPPELKKEGPNEAIGEEKRQAAVHQYRSVCHGDGTCTYIFTLTVPSKNGMFLPPDVDSMTGSIDSDSPMVKVIQEQLQTLHNTLYNLTTVSRYVYHYVYDLAKIIKFCYFST